MNASVATAIDSNGVGRTKESAGTQFEELFDGVDDLIKRVADVENPEIRRIRAKVYAALAAAKRAIVDGAPKFHRETVQAESTDDPLRECPEQALGVALLLGLGLGLAVSLRQ
jgi:ElaB/YqjD/DUF883 family membrane-anchored ribosome-binding protein